MFTKTQEISYTPIGGSLFINLLVHTYNGSSLVLLSLCLQTHICGLSKNLVKVYKPSDVSTKTLANSLHTFGLIYIILCLCLHTWLFTKIQKKYLQTNRWLINYQYIGLHAQFWFTSKVINRFTYSYCWFA